MKKTTRRSALLSGVLGSGTSWMTFLVIAFTVFLQVTAAHPPGEQAQATLSKIKSLGGSIGFYSLSSSMSSNWLLDDISGASNEPAIQPIRAVFLQNSTVPSNLLAEFECFSHLEQLFLNNCVVSDEGLANLVVLQKLVRLHLGQTRVDQTGLIYLKKMNRLQALDLNDAHITDAGLEQLRELTHLELVLTKSPTRASSHFTE